MITVYETIPMQLYLQHNIKTPIINAFETLYDRKSSRLAKLKAIRDLWRAFGFMKSLPEPTVGSTGHPNTHNLIRLRDWLKEHLFLDGNRKEFVFRVINFAIIIYDSVPPYRFIGDSLMEEAFKMEWQPKDILEEEDAWWKN